jgi:hypothetical protein
VRKFQILPLIFLSAFLTIFASDYSAAESTTQPAPPTTRPVSTTQPAPRYTVVRWDENYQYLQHAPPPHDFWDPIKFIPMNSSGDWYASFGGQVRDRYEYFNNYLFGSGPQSTDGYNLARFLADVDLHFGPNVRVFLQGIGAFEAGRNGGPRATDSDALDLEQGFADLLIPLPDQFGLTLRGGRQYLQYGAQRLIGPSDFLNTPHTFDGFRANLDSQNNSLDFFLVRPALVEKYRFDSSDDNNVLAGIYDTLALPQLMPHSSTALELYGLFLDRQHSTYPTSPIPGTENRYTLGTRFSSNPKPWDIDVEADYQLGNFKSEDIQAYSFATSEGYTFADLLCHPRIYLGFNIASGSNRGGNTLGTFNQLYPTAHGQFGNIDAIGRQNIIDVNPGLDLTLLQHVKYADPLKLRISFYEFWRQSLEDAVYMASGSVLRFSGASNARYIGSELDLLLNWQIDRHLSSYIGYSHFFAGTFIQETGPSNDIDFFYTAITYTF